MCDVGGVARSDEFTENYHNSAGCFRLTELVIVGNHITAKDGLDVAEHVCYIYFSTW